jgi:F-box interacting protein
MDSRPIKQPQSTAPPTFVPDELIAEILSLLCVKTIVRFKCVSKSWNTLISDPTFVDKHLKKSTQKQNLVVIWYNNIEGGYNVSPIPLSHLIKNPSITIYNDSNINYLENGCYIAGSCNGLICLFYKSHSRTRTVDQEDYSIYFWNPSTRKKSKKLGSFSHTLPLDSVQCVSNSFQFAFGYDDSSKTYKVVAFHVEENKPALAKSEVKVFSLGGNCWRNIQSFPVIPLNWLDYGNTSINSGVHLCGTINWLAIHKYFHPYYIYEYNSHVEDFVIISLDLSTETYKQLLLPQGFDEVPFIQPVLKVLMECLCFSHDTREYDFVLWQMKEYGVQESWTQLFKISYHNLQENYSNSVCGMACLYKNGDMVILVNAFGHHRNAMIYNLRNGEIDRIRVNDSLFSLANVYVESLVAVC